MLDNLVRRKLNWLVIVAVIALLVGILYALPQFFIWKNLKSIGLDYEVIQLTHHSDEAYGTWSRFREIYDGHFVPGDLYFGENNNTPFGPFQILPMLMAGFLYVFNGNTNAAYIASRFILPIILFYLFYLLGLVLTKDKLWAIFLGILGIFTPIVNHLLFPFKSLDNFSNIILKNFIPAINTPLPDLFWSRVEDPLLTYLILLPAIICLILFWRKPGIKIALVGSIFVGLLFYSYFHYWVFLSIVLGVLFGVLVFLKIINKNIFENYLNYFLVYILSIFVVTIPYWINMFKFSSLSSADDVRRRMGVTFGRYFHFINPFSIVFDYIFYLLLGIAVYFIFLKFKKDYKKAVLYWAFLGAMFIVWNIQLVMGYAVFPDHWFRAISPFIFIILFDLFFSSVGLLKINRNKVGLIFYLLIALLISKKIINIFIFTDMQQPVLKEYSFNDSTVNLWRWVNHDLSNEPTIVSDSFITGLYLNSRTSTRPFLAGGFNSYVANNILEDRFLCTYKLFGIKTDEMQKLLKGDPKDFCFENQCLFGDDFHKKNNLTETSAYLYVSYYYYKHYPERKTDGKSFLRVTPEVADRLIKKYDTLNTDYDILPKDSYALIGPWERDLSKNYPIFKNNFDLVFKNSEVELYKLK